MSDLARELSEVIEGEVRFDRLSRLLYSNDASIYQIEPIGVVIPKHQGDVEQAVRTAARKGIPILPRGGGTSLAGQAVGEAVILDLSKYMRRVIELSEDEAWVRVQPGIVHDVLSDYLKPYGLRFGPETATSNRANLGGMVGNNSAGARSLIYGKTVDNVLEVKTVLSDGSEAIFGTMSWSELEDRTLSVSLESRIYQRVLELAKLHRDEIKRRYPNIPRRVSGYNLDELLDPEKVNLAKLIVGSEGTLATVVESKLALVPIPKATGLAVLHFGGLLPALETGCEILELEPSAVELIDRMVIELARESLEYSRRLHFIEGEPHALLVVEFNGENRTAVVAKMDALETLIGNQARPMIRILDPVEQLNVWKVRKAALPLLLGLPGDKKPIAFVEDTAVTPERVPEFINRFEKILGKRDTVGSFYAHAGAGCLHIRPLVNLKNGAEISKMKAIADEVFELVVEFGGSMSGEHGDGLARSHFNEQLFGAELYGAFKELKAAFDPKGIMNPGKIVDAPAMTDNLRYGETYQTLQPSTFFPYKKEGGFARAVELCNGAGVCRKNLDGTMCPSFMVTREELHSTRGRANALRAMLDGRLLSDEMGRHDLYKVMDLCVSCKGCKAECPSNVDMARLKSEFLASYHQWHGYSLRDRVITRADRLGRLGVASAPVSNWLLRQRWFRHLMEAIIGVDRRRSLPPYARRTFESWFYSRRPKLREQRRRVVLFHDTFMNYYEPEIGIAATKLLEESGFKVILARAGCCGRPAISKGMLEEAQALSSANIESLYKYASEGVPIVGCEPSCLLSLRDEYPDLIPGERAKIVARNTFLLEEFFQNEGIRLHYAESLEHLVVHVHCHVKALVGIEPLVNFLHGIGRSVEVVDSGCCGMAGSFGYEKEHFDISVQMGERRLLPAIRTSDDATVVVASGTSCRHQIKDGTGREAIHPAVVAARAAGLMKR